MRFHVKKIIAILLCFSCLFATFSLPAKADSDETVTTRALLIGLEGSNLKDGPKLDCAHLKAALEKSANVQSANITYVGSNYNGGSDTRETVLSSIASSFSGADDDDVNILYYSGHGSYSKSEKASYLCITSSDYSDYWLTAKDIVDYVVDNNIHGKFVIIIDACHSGGMVEKSVSSVVEHYENELDQSEYCAEDLSYSAEIFMNEFAAELRDTASFSQSRSTAITENGDRFSVLAAAGYQHTSIQYNSDDICGVFTTSLTIGIGYSPAEGSTDKRNYHSSYTQVAHNSYPADTNNDGTVTLGELYRWTKMYNTSSLTRCYPENSDLPMVTYDKTQHAGALITSAKAETPLVYASTSSTVTINYETSIECPIFCQGMFSYSYAYLNLQKPDDTIYPNSYVFYNNNHFTLPAGTEASQGCYSGSQTITLDTSELSGIYLLRLIATDGTDTNAHPDAASFLIPIQVVTPSDKDKEKTYSDSSSFALSLSSTSMTIIESSNNELDISASFAKNSNSNTASGVLLSLYIKDSNGETVSTLADNVSATYVANSLNKPTIYEGVNHFFWNGKTDQGYVVPSGTYTVALTGKYYYRDSSTTPLVCTTTKDFTVYSPYSSHTVTYYDPYGNVLAKETVAYNAPAPQLSKTVNGYSFLGWYTKNGSTTNDWGNLWDFNTPITEDTSLYFKGEKVVGASDSIGDSEYTPGVGGNTGTLTIKVTSAHNGCVLLAEYNEYGRILRLFTADVTGNNSNSSSVSFNLNSTTGCTYRAFLTEVSFWPVDAKPISFP